MTDTGAGTPLTDQGQWLLDHQGLVNIGRIDWSMRGDEIDLRAAILTIEREAMEIAARSRPATDPAGLDAHALAAALHETAPRHHNLGEGLARAICDNAESHRPRAERILARLAVADGPGPTDD